ncbi:MAG: Rieske (2Fe-2S) protein [Edaphobacter sp.]|uniref:Rieske (2Fe-2S) protein n=1 Tax=Edaphobacter sp. TaxID=1934404 RepID=UPI0023A6BC18|nr:Rieske (2Fe-2S) protein [Edaphobacter sp.]MDE1176673.1 Rieske (2Fe-2S) protein [Edaphobacter sp.]
MIVKLCNASELPAPGAMRTFRGHNLQLCVARPEDAPERICVFDNRCPHQGAPLNTGHLEGSTVVCPYHAWRFDIATGQPQMPCDPPLITYEARQYDDEIFIRIP